MASGERIGQAYVEARLDQSRLRADTAAAGRNIQQSLQQTGQALRTTGAQLTRRVTMPIVAMGAGIVKVAADFESSMNRVSALTGATGQEFDRLRGRAEELGRTTQFSAAQAADGMGFLAMAGFEVNEIYEAMPGVLNLAASGQMELAESADIVSNVLTGMGMEVSELDHLVDVMAATFTSANTDMRQLGDAMAYVAPVAASVGMSVEEAAAAIGLMGDAGIQGSRAGTSLRGAITRLLNPTGEAADILERLGVNATNASGELTPLDQIIQQLDDSGASAADMMTIFGQRAGPAMSALLDRGAGALRDFTGELQESGGTAERIAETQMEGLRGAMLRMRSAAEGAAIAIADTGLLGGVANFAENIAGAFQSLSEANPELLKFGVIVAGGVAAAGPVLWAVGAALSALGVLLSPGAVVMAGLVGLGVALVNLVGEGDTFAERFMDAIGKVEDFVGPAVDWIVEKVSAVGEWFGWTRETVADEAQQLSQEGARAFFDLANDTEQALWEMRDAVDDITPGMVSDVVGHLEAMKEQGGAAIRGYKDEAFEDILWLSREAGVITEEMANDLYSETLAMANESSDNFNFYADAAIAELRELEASGEEITGEMIDDILGRLNPFVEEGAEEFANYDAAAVSILERLKATSGRLSLEMAQQHIEESARRREESIAEADEEYAEAVAIAVHKRDVLGTLSAEEADRVIRDAERKHTDSVAEAKGMHDEVVTEVTSMNSEVIGSVNTMTGEFISGWENLQRDVASRAVLIGRDLADLGGKIRDFGSGARGVFDAIESTVSGVFSRSADHVLNGVNSIIGFVNGMIRGVNRVSEAVGLGSLLSEISTIGSRGSGGRSSGGLSEYHEGGMVGPGGGRPRDPSKPLAPDEELAVLKHGERVLTADETDEIGGPLDTIGEAVRRGASAAGSAVRKVGETISDLPFEAIRRSRGVVASVLESGIPTVPDLSGYGMAGTFGTYAGNKARSGVIDWISGIDDELSTREVGPGVGWEAMWEALSAQFPWARLTSSYRPGAITATGNPSYHGMGRAIDVAGRGRMNHSDMLTMAQWIAAEHGSQTAELIYSRGPSLINGSPWTPTGITRQNHYDHVHWAMENGGVINQPTLGLLGESAKARPEIVTPQRLMADTFRDVISEGRSGPLIGEMHFNGTGRDTQAEARHQARLLAREVGR